MSLDILLQDLKYTLRTLGRDPGFTTVAVLILALAIGANIAVFSVVNTLMLRPLPFPNAQQLVWIAPPPTKCGLSCATYSTDAYDEFRVGSRSYQDVTGYFAFSSPDNLSLKLGGAPIPATSIDVIANFFQVLGVQPAMGRVFTPEDARNGAPPVILLSDAWWRRQFNADPNIVGKAFDINGHQTTVIGVLPCELRLRRRLRSRHKGRRHHAAQSLRSAARLGQHHHHDRSPQARRLSRPGSQAMPCESHLPCAGTTNTRILAAHTQSIKGRRGGPRSTQGLRQRKTASRPDRLVVRRRRHPPHCLRQSLQSAPGPRRCTQQGIRHARCPRRQPRSYRSSAADR